MIQTVSPIIDYKYGFNKPENYVFKSKKGLNKKIVEEISWYKNEPDWMRKFRLEALEIFWSKHLPVWGGDLTKINFDDIYYYIRPIDKKTNKWEDLPAEIKDTYDKIGIPEAEKKYLGGISAQYESESVYNSIQSTLTKKGVIFLDMDSALREFPDIVKEYFGSLIPFDDNKFAALNSAVWSGGSFVYVPKGVKVDLPLQAYFRINAANMGQFERTLIIAEEGSFVHYVEGCTAPVYTTDSLHSAVVEIFVKKGARVRYTTIQNWSTNIYNLVTKRMRIEEEAYGDWIDGNLGCLAEDSIIFTNNKLKQIKDISIGEKLFSLNNNFKLSLSTVIAKKKNPPQKVYKLQTEDFREIEASSNHPFLTVQKYGKIQTLSWKKLEDINKDDFIAVSGNIPWKGESYQINFQPSRGLKKFNFPSISSEDLLWFLGFYLGDGYVDKNRVYIALTKNDKSYSKILKITKKYFGLKPEKKGSVLRYNSIAFVDFIKFLRFTGNASTKTIPSWVYTLDKIQIQALINGYIDADGYRRDNHRNISITSVN